MPTPSTPHHAPSILFTLQELPCARFVAYWHRAFGSPSLSTFINALISDFISIPRLTPALVRKYPPLSCATSFGHLDTLRQGIASPRRSPSPHALGSSAAPLSRKPRRRMAFLKDCDDLDELDFPAEPPPSVLPLSFRRSSRLASSPSSLDTLVRTLHGSEWTAADLTGRFPIPSVNEPRIYFGDPTPRVHSPPTHENQVICLSLHISLPLKKFFYTSRLSLSPSPT